MSQQATLTARMGARPEPGESGRCAGCGHVLALHENGTSACRAFACRGGPSAQCGACGGGANPATASGCKTCKGSGAVRLPCPGFVPALSGQAA